MSDSLLIADIDVGQRSRSEIRNVESLARSIREHSLLHAPVVRRDGERWVLVCGERRLAAMRSLGWTETPVTIAETIADELAALYAEGDENTEREPFTVTEAVEHRRRIRDAETRAARERQRAAGRAHGRGQIAPGNFPEPIDFPEPADAPHPEPEPEHKRTTRERTAKATGYSGKTLDKAEKVLNLAEDETLPEPARETARQAAENLARPGAKVDREYKSVEKAVAEHSDHAQAYQDAQWRKQLTAELSRLSGLKTFPPERVLAVCDDDLLFLIDSVCGGVADWHAEICDLRKPGLRVMQGGAS